MNSWGNYPKQAHKNYRLIHWRDETALFDTFPVLPRGAGKSYGDSCLNENGVLICTRVLNRMITFDRNTGVLCCEAGITIKDILDVVTPKGWILPVMPGTQYVTIGGAIANDVHGKNHHQRGSFGCHVIQFELLRSDHSRHLCSREHNAALFYATIGGLGLTGLILWAEIQLMPLRGASMEVTIKPFYTFEEYQALNVESEKTHEYTSAWIDGTPGGVGIYFAANHVDQKKINRSRSVRIPAYCPNITLNNITISIFNRLYVRAQLSKSAHKLIQSISQHLFPLDHVHQWNLLYGTRGLVQYQCVVPSLHSITELLATVSRAGEKPFLSVLKTFGDIQSGGLLSFPATGLTLAMDFPFKGKKTLAMLDALDHIVMRVGGRVYPAKDARMSPGAFRCYFPQLALFQLQKDSGFSSSFWRRVMGDE